MMNKRKGWLLFAGLAMMTAVVVYQQGVAAGKEGILPARIGVVNVSKILESCKKNQQWQEKAQAEKETLQAEFKQMRAEMEALQANLKTRKEGNDDYFSLMAQLEEKRAVMKGKNDFYEAKYTQEMKLWMESLYNDFLKAAEQVAKEKNLDMVVGKETLDVKAPTLRDFMLSVKTKKVLYNHTDLDITGDVLAALDKMTD